MKTKTIFYKMTNLSQSRKVLIKRKLFGYIDHSNKGNYKYRRKGLLENIEHFKPVKSALIVKPDDLQKITDLFQKYNVKFVVIDSFVKKDLLK